MVSRSNGSGGFGGFGDGPNRNFKSLFSMDDISAKTQAHLTRVYLTLMGCAGTCAAGMALNATVLISNFIFTILFIAAMAYLIYQVHNRSQSEQTRIVYLLAFAMLMGLQSGPFINSVLDFYPGVIPQAVAYSASSFGSFSLISLFSARRSYLFLGSIISSLLMGMCMYSLVQYFTGNVLGIGFVFMQLILTSFMIVYDTQVIVEQAELGDRDVPTHTLTLFEDLFRLFMQIVKILIEMQDSDKRKKRR